MIIMDVTSWYQSLSLSELEETLVCLQSQTEDKILKQFS